MYEVKESYSRNSHRDVGVLEKWLGRQPAIKGLPRNGDSWLERAVNAGIVWIVGATWTGNLGDYRVARAVLYDDVIVNIVLLLIVYERSVHYPRGRLVSRDASVGGGRRTRSSPASHRGDSHGSRFSKVDQTRIRISSNFDRPALDTASRADH